MHMFSPSGLVPKLPDDLDGISPIAGLGNGGKYTQLGVLLSKNKGSRHQTMRAWGLEPGTRLSCLWAQTCLGLASCFSRCSVFYTSIHVLS